MVRPSSIDGNVIELVSRRLGVSETVKTFRRGAWWGRHCDLSSCTEWRRIEVHHDTAEDLQGFIESLLAGRQSLSYVSA
jgi:hypothetical protein